MSEPSDLQLEWEPHAEGFVCYDEHGEAELEADDFSARYKAGDMEWEFTLASDAAEAQWVAEMAKVALDALYERIAKERERRKAAKRGAGR